MKPNTPTRVAYLCLQAMITGQAPHAHVHEIINGLNNQNCDVTLFEPKYPKGTPGVLGRLLEIRRVQRRLLASIDQFDIVYIRGHALAVRVAKAAKKRGLPVVQECNGMVDDFFIAWPPSRLIAPLIRQWTYRQFRDADAVITGSTGLHDWLLRETGVDSAIIPNGANTDIFQPTERPENIELPEQYVVFFGSLAPWQGLSTTLKAATSTQWPLDLDLVIVGDGALKSKVVETALKYSHIHYLGTLPYDLVSGVVANSICSLVNKEQDEFARAGISPLKLYESMACGVPVIATENMPGLTEVVQEQRTGIVIQQRDPHALIDAVLALQNDTELGAKMGANGRRFAVAECSWIARADETARVIDKISRLSASCG